jgi:hypothetical protein
MKTMAPSDTVAHQSSTAATTAGSLSGWWVVVLGWLFPGMGYFAQCKWVRGALIFVCVVGMFVLGLALSGQTYGFNTGDLLAILGWVGDLCAGALYFITRSLGGGAAVAHSVMGDYGTTMMISAGLLNILAASDARDVFLGLKK